MAKMWAGRTDGQVEKIADDFNSSIRFDCRMYRQDIQGSMAHAAMLSAQNIITQSDADQLIDGLSGVQRGIGILEDQLHILAGKAQLLLVHLIDVLALEQDLTGGGLYQTQNGTAGSGLAAAGLTNQTQGLTLFDGKADVIHSVEHTALGGKMFGQILDL